MTYCLNPDCRYPQNDDGAEVCQGCHQLLLLKQRYRPVAALGQGGFGKTFLAVDEFIPSRPKCVIKQLSLVTGDVETQRKVVSLFRQEAIRLDDLGKHPQIPNLLAYCEQNRLLYLVQEFIPGKTLAQEFNQRTSYTETSIRELLLDLLPVLSFIHKKQVIHRDIKPSNIIRYSPQLFKGLPFQQAAPTDKTRMTNSQSIAVGRQDLQDIKNRGNLPENWGGTSQNLEREDLREGQFVLIDFGVSKFLSQEATQRTGTIIGSPEYMAPEQTRGKAFPSSDIYSLGVTCLQLLTGMNPFELFDVVENCWRWQDFLSPQNGVGEKLAGILDKMVIPAMKDRYQTANEVLADLQIQPCILAKSVEKPDLIELVNIAQIDCQNLEKMLARKQWKAADQETWKLLCLSLGKNIGTYLGMGEIYRLPCADLALLDELWVKYSQSRFGFSIQKQIYELVGKDYHDFCQQVGWLSYNPAIPEKGFNFSLKAPMGHLPSRLWAGGYEWWRHAGAMAERLEQCEISII